MTVTVEIHAFSPEQARALKIALAKEIARKRAADQGKGATPPTPAKAVQDLEKRSR